MKKHPEEYDVTVMTTVTHTIRVKVPEDLRPVGEGAAIAMVRRMDPPAIRRDVNGWATTSYVTGAVAVPLEVES